MISLGIILAIFILIQLFAIKSRTGIESYPYKVEQSFNGFEVRTYEASLFSSVKVGSGEYKQVAGQGFSALGGYIFGANEDNQKIAMTSPVTMSLGDSSTMMFMIPKGYKESDLPKPNNGNISFKEMPDMRVAAITFGGWADSKKIEIYKNKLIKMLKDQKIEHTSTFFFLGYNPPYDVFGRKNEVIVKLE